jgi:hypothetical protein
VTAAIRQLAETNGVAEIQDGMRQLAAELLQLALKDLPEPEFFGEMLQKVVRTLAVPAGVVWRKNKDDEFAAEVEVAPGPQLPLRTAEQSQQRSEALERAARRMQPVLHHGSDGSGDHSANAGQAWRFLFVPVLVRQRTEAVLEIWLDPARAADAAAGMTHYLTRLADLAAVFLARRATTAGSDPELWSRIESFTRRIHSSLDLTDVGLRVVNEGQLLLGCDRVSVAVRRGSKAVIEAVSGTDTVERRANLIQRMTALCQAVMTWGERLVYTGRRDASLPGHVLKKLDEYVQVSFCKLLILYPMQDEREKEFKRPGRSLLVVENFTTTQPAELLEARLETLSRHMAPALYNANSFRQLPFGWIWKPLAAVKEGLAGRTKVIVGLVAAAVAALLAALIWVPYPLRMEAKGQLLPVERRWIYSPVEGQVVRFEQGVAPGSQVVQDQALMLMHDLQLEARIMQLNAEIQAAQSDMDAIAKMFNAAANETDRLRLSGDRRQKEALRDRYFVELRTLRERTNSERGKAGHFWLKSPINGTVLSWDFRENLTNRLVKPSEPLLRIGDKNKAWEVECRIPQKHMGQIIQAFARLGGQDELDVDLLLLSAPTQTFKGKLARDKLAGEAAPLKEHPTDVEPVVLASVRIDGPDIPADWRIPPELLVPGTDVNARIDCGPHAMGYSLFYGVWEFFYEKVAFAF